MDKRSFWLLQCMSFRVTDPTIALWHLDVRESHKNSVFLMRSLNKVHFFMGTSSLKKNKIFLILVGIFGGVGGFLLLALVVVVIVTYKDGVYSLQRRIGPGGQFRVLNPSNKQVEHFRVPNIPMYRSQNAWSFHKGIQSQSFAYQLSFDYLSQMAKLLYQASMFFAKMEIPMCLSDGSLLGYVRQGSFLPWDDDLDCWVGLEHRKKLWTSEAKKIADEFGLMFSCMRDASFEKGTFQSTPIRLHLKGLWTPLLDIYFVTAFDSAHLPPGGKGSIAKEHLVDANLESPPQENLMIAQVWKLTPKEIHILPKTTWSSETVRPVTKVNFHGSLTHIPKDAKTVLKSTYSDDVLENQRYRGDPITGQQILRLIGNIPFRKHLPGI